MRVRWVSAASTAAAVAAAAAGPTLGRLARPSASTLLLTILSACRRRGLALFLLLTDRLARFRCTVKAFRLAAAAVHSAGEDEEEEEARRVCVINYTSSAA